MRMGLPPTADRPDRELPVLLGPWAVGLPEGFHWLHRGLITDVTVRSFFNSIHFDKPRILTEHRPGLKAHVRGIGPE